MQASAKFSVLVRMESVVEGEPKTVEKELQLDNITIAAVARIAKLDQRTEDNVLRVLLCWAGYEASKGNDLTQFRKIVDELKGA